MKRIFRKRLLLLSLLMFSIGCQNVKTETKPHWKYATEATGDLAHQFEKKYQLRLLNHGCGVLVESNYVQWDMSLMSREKLDLAKTRTLIVKMIKEFSDLILSDAHFEESLKEQAAIHTKRHTPEINLRRLGIKLSFWDENMDRPLEPYVALVMVREGRIQYFYTNPKDQSLLPSPYEESFEEAFSIEKTALTNEYSFQK